MKSMKEALEASGLAGEAMGITELAGRKRGRADDAMSADVAPRIPFDPRPYLIDIHGNRYLPVAARVAWFRHEHPEGQIETRKVGKEEWGGGSKEIDLWRAEVRIGGQVIATAHKGVHEFKMGSRDFGEEKSETGAIGRALALAGYGTLEAGSDLDESDLLADTPVARGSKIANPEYATPDSENALWARASGMFVWNSRQWKEIFERCYNLYGSREEFLAHMIELGMNGKLDSQEVPEAAVSIIHSILEGHRIIAEQATGESL